MHAPAPVPKRKNVPVLPVVLIGLAAVVFFGGILAFAIFRNTTQGEVVGAVDVRAAPGSLPVELHAGDALHFRIDAEFGAPPGGSNKRRVDVLDDALRRSKLTVRLARSGAAERATSCPVYAGAGRLGHVSATTVQRSMVNDCAFVVDAAGSYVVRAEVAWGGVDVRGATLQVRREREKDR
jgi:hypothetical protein